MNGGSGMSKEQRLLAAAYHLSSLRVDDAVVLKQEILSILANYFAYEYSTFWELERGELHVNPVRRNITKFISQVWRNNTR